MAYKYETCCVESTANAIDAMTEAAKEVSYQTFRKAVGGAEVDRWASHMGYDVGNQRGGLRLSKDWAVSFHQSTYNDVPCYYVVHSAIEYIFTESP